MRLNAPSGIRRTATTVFVALLATATSGAQVSVAPPPRPPAAPGASAAESSGLITGRVIDGTSNAPVGAVVVTLVAGGQAEYLSNNRVLTDAEGRFFFGSLTPGRYTLTTSKPGWMPGAYGRLRPGASSQPIELREREARPDIVIRTWRYAVVSGRVTDEATEAVIGADVFIYQQTFTAGRRQFVFSARAITDDRGMFRFASLLPGDYVVMVPATVTSEPSTLGQGEGNTYLRTMTGLGAAPILGERADVPSGAGRPFVTSALSVPSAPGATGVWMTYTSTLAPSATALRSAQLITAVAGRERQGADVQVRYVQTHRVSGSLTDHEGKAAPAHAIHLLPADMADYPIFDVATAVTDATGAFTFFGVPAGNYVARVVRIPLVQGGRVSQCGGTGELSTICANTFGPNGPLPLSADPLLFGEQSIAVADRDVTGLTIAMRAGARVSGSVEFDGTSERPTEAQLARSGISLEAAGGQMGRAAGSPFDNLQPGQFLPDGRFGTPSTLPGRYLLRVNGLPAGWTLKSAVHQGRDISQTAVALTSDISDVVITLTDHPLKIEGTIQDPDKVAGTGAIAILFPSDRASWVDYGQTSRRVQSVPISENRFTMLAPPDGEYLLIAIPDEMAADWQNPAFLERLMTQADRLIVAGNTSITRTLRVRRVP
jgi:hypothetical protein